MEEEKFDFAAAFRTTKDWDEVCDVLFDRFDPKLHRLNVEWDKTMEMRLKIAMMSK